MDLLISHSQIQFRSRPFDEASSQWGEVNLEQGAIIHSDYVVFDPLPEDAFGANMHLKLEDSFHLDPCTQHPAPSTQHPALHRRAVSCHRSQSCGNCIRC
ncbi:competence protein ComJ [Pseudomonas sp. P9_31]|uniref:competence protein ComJ n=1 Tax=Pseudomonas sp. P9_31 TaxID=3043448 RepID=UPI002A35D57E|nr:competence protein ComJ [Pseudomonas sp. P9_31]WPN60826.1 competence protein ComJ [Pseudomonas sp. P9_31]